MIGSKPTGMEFGIAARKKHRVGLRVRPLVVERREADDLGAVRSPLLDKVGIGKGKCLIGGNGNALAEGRERAVIR
jgi:hypothetical protein